MKKDYKQMAWVSPQGAVLWFLKDVLAESSEARWSAFGIATATGLSVDRVRRELNILLECGIVTRRKAGGGPGYVWQAVHR